MIHKHTWVDTPYSSVVFMSTFTDHTPAVIWTFQDGLLRALAHHIWQVDLIQKYAKSDEDEFRF